MSALDRLMVWVGVRAPMQAVGHVYRDAHILCVPTVARTKVGTLLDMEPFAVLQPNDAAGLATALLSRMIAPMRRVATPPRDQPAAMLKYTRYRRWTELEKSMALWSVKATSSGWEVVRYQRRVGGRGLEAEDAALADFSGDPATVATAIAQLLTAAD